MDIPISKTILAHTAACMPVGSCDWVMNTFVGEWYFPYQNLSAEPTVYFHVDLADYLRAQTAGDVTALAYSHPGGLPFLSDADRRLQVQSGLPWWLVCSDRIHKFHCMPFLTGRTFEHGVTDRYTLFRDTYHLAGIETSDSARKENWWKQGDNLYLGNLEATGSHRVNATEARSGDIPTYYFGSSVANHVAAYCGDGELLHHIPDQLGKRERYTNKWQRRTHSVWRHRAWYEPIFTGVYGDLDAASVSA